MTIDGHLRIALFDAYGGICQLGHHPIDIASLQVDHLVPEKFTGDRLAQQIAAHNLAADYDVHATYNLVPTCSTHNRGKTDTPLPETNATDLLFLNAQKKAAAIDAAAAKFKKHNAILRAYTILVGQPDLGVVLTDGQMQTLNDALLGTAIGIEAVTGQRFSPAQLYPSGPYHDTVTPELVDPESVGIEFFEGDLYGVLEAWMDHNSQEAKELVADRFNGPEQKLLSAGIREVLEVKWAPGIGIFLAKVDISIEYRFTPEDEGTGEYSTTDIIDLWVELDEKRETVVTIIEDAWDSFS